VIFVPLIEWCSFGLGILASRSMGLGQELFQVGGFKFALDLSLIYAVCTGVYYLSLDTFAGFLRILILAGEYTTVKYFIESGYPDVLTVLVVLKILGWVFQIVSHKIWEGRAPALLDNLLQALVLAPFFVLFEGLFCLGYQPKLKKEVEDRVAKLREEFLKKEKKY